MLAIHCHKEGPQTRGSMTCCPSIQVQKLRKKNRARSPVFCFSSPMLHEVDLNVQSGGFSSLPKTLLLECLDCLAWTVALDNTLMTLDVRIESNRRLYNCAQRLLRHVQRRLRRGCASPCSAVWSWCVQTHSESEAEARCWEKVLCDQHGCALRQLQNGHRIFA